MCEFYAKANSTVDFFEKNFGELPKTSSLKMNIGALSTSYSMKRREVGFSCAKKFINCGLSSTDVISHEIFHGLLCTKFSKLCDPDFSMAKEHQAAHEALAYYFGFSMNPDALYGENYRKDMKALRPFVPTLIPELMVGSHGLGMGGFSSLVSNRVSLKEVATWLETIKGQDEITIESLVNFARKGKEAKIKNFPFSFSGLGSSRIRLDRKGIDISINPSDDLIKLTGELTYSLTLLEDLKSQVPGVQFQVSGFPKAIGRLESLPNQARSIHNAALVVRDKNLRIIGFYPFILINKP